MVDAVGEVARGRLLLEKLGGKGLAPLFGEQEIRGSNHLLENRIIQKKTLYQENGKGIFKNCIVLNVYL